MQTDGAATLPLQFLKLGGSLITEKTRPHTPRPQALARLASEIAAAWQQAAWQQAAWQQAAWQQQPGMRLVLGHGSGSYGHVPARRYGTRQGVHTAQEWGGFIEVWREAAALNRLVVDALGEAGLPAMAFPPSAGLTAQDGRLAAWDLSALHAALQAGLLPVVYGDVVFDTRRGGTIFSTEDLFEILAVELKPGRLLLAGLEAGVWLDYPQRTRLVEQITPDNYPQIAPALGGSAATDVTGGMASKVEQSLALAGRIPGLEVCIFSGEQPGELQRALLGAVVGTRIRAHEAGRA